MPSKVTVTLRTSDNIPENFVQNQFCTLGLTGAPTEAEQVADALRVFYGDLMAPFYGSNISAGPHLVKFYELPGLEPNYPYHETEFSFGTPGSGTPLPAEVALCLSFQAQRTPGLPQARRRGRIYLGPMQDTANDDGRPSTSIITSILDAAETLAASIAAVSSAQAWAVWSPTAGEAVEITELWVDDAFDTQRSRGLARTTRTVRPL